MEADIKFAERSARQLDRQFDHHPVRGFVTDEGGAVTTDWVVLTAGIVGLGIAAIALVHDGSTGLSDSTAAALANVDIDDGGIAGENAASGTGAGAGDMSDGSSTSGDDGGSSSGDNTGSDAGSGDSATSDGSGTSGDADREPRRGTDSQRGRRAAR